MRKFLHILFILSASLVAQSQTSIDLSINPLVTQPPFRVSYGDTISYATEITNQDSITFSGTLFIAFKGSNSTSYDSLNLGTVQIPPAGSIQRTISIDVQPQYFKPGPEVVVVWPIFSGTAGNQVADFIFVKDNLSNIEDNSLSETNYFVWNNNLKTNTDNNLLKQVRIFNLSGQEIFNTQNKNTPIALPILNAGLYFIQIEKLNGEFSTIKWIKN
ncbi:MAG: T9SS type A sorting domain-containing protein [Chitinophagales bacterium]|nr:T9SS type A sorting domain-containing protein [Chitinophagales bacterium]MCO5281569.1 T9SS type A sorting domain-containing protein [Chitinophagales bacterium]